MGFTCRICGRAYSYDRQTKICPSCNSLIRQMSKTIPYQERAEILRQQVKYGIFGTIPQGIPVSLSDTLQVKACRRCVWRRSVNGDCLHVECSLPTCAKGWGKRWRART